MRVWGAGRVTRGGPGGDNDWRRVVRAHADGSVARGWEERGGPAVGALRGAWRGSGRTRSRRFLRQALTPSRGNGQALAAGGKRRDGANDHVRCPLISPPYFLPPGLKEVDPQIAA